MATLGVQIVGDAAGYKAALGESLAATNRFAEGVKAVSVDVRAQFAGMSTAALQAAAAADKLAISTARYGEGSLGAANATVAYRKQIESLAASSQASLATVGRNLSTYVTLPLAAIGYEAAKQATAFQAAMLQIQTQAGASAAEVKTMSAAILDFAASGQSQQGPVQLAQALFHLESVGLRGAQALDALKVSSRAAAVGMASLEDVATALGGAVVTGINGTQDYTQAMGMLNAIVGAGNMHMEDLTAALGTGILPKAKNVGLSLQEVGAALAVLTDRGFSAQRAATQLGTTFALIAAPSAAAQKALADMGISAGQLSTDMRSGPDGLLKALDDLAAGMDRVGKQQGAADILGAFGRSRQSGAILTLVESLNAAVSNYQGKFQQIGETQGNLLASEAKQAKTAQAQFHEDLAALQADAIKLGDALLPVLTQAAGDVTKLADAFSKLPAPVKTALGEVAGGFAVGGPIILGIVGVQKMLRALGTTFRVTLPADAAAGAAATDLGVAGIGAAATGAEAKVGLLSKSLTGLGALTIAPIVIPITYEITTSILKATGAYGALEGFGATLAGPAAPGSVASRTSFEEALGAAQNLFEQYGSDFQHAGPQERQAAGALMRRFPGITAEQWAQIWNLAAQAPNPITGGAGHTSARLLRNIPLGPTTKPKTGAGGAPTPFQTFTETQIPYELRLKAAEAAASGNTKALQQADEAMKAWIAQMVGEHRYVGQGLIDALNYESTLNDKAATAANKSTESAKKLAAAKKKAEDARIQAYEEHLLGLGPGGEPTTPGAEALRTKEREMLVKILAEAGAAPSTGVRINRTRVGSHIRIRGVAGQETAKATAAQIAAMTSATSEETLQQLVADVEKTFGSELPKSVETNLEKINEVLKQKFLPADVRQNIRDRLTQIAQTLTAGLAQINQAAQTSRPVTAEQLTAGLGLSEATRRALEARIAQESAHNGRVPTTVGAAGGSIVINGNVNLPDVHTPEQFLKELQKKARRGVTQTRGPNAGRGVLSIH